jgi:hypothetical protein
MREKKVERTKREKKREINIKYIVSVFIPRNTHTHKQIKQQEKKRKRRQKKKLSSRA